MLKLLLIGNIPCSELRGIAGFFFFCPGEIILQTITFILISTVCGQKPEGLKSLYSCKSGMELHAIGFKKSGKKMRT